MVKQIRSKTLPRRLRRRHGPPAGNEMVQVLPKRRKFLVLDDRVIAITEGSRIHAAGKLSSNTNLLSVNVPGDIGWPLAVRALIVVAASIARGGWPGEFTTGTMTADEAKECMRVEEQEHSRLAPLMKALRLGEDIFDEAGPMWTDLDAMLLDLIDRLLELIDGFSPPSIQAGLRSVRRRR
jgi:hypothetical protein